MICSKTNSYLLWLHSPTTVGLGLIVEVSRLHSDTPHSAELPWTSDRPVAETSTWKRNTNKRKKIHAAGGIFFNVHIYCIISLYIFLTCPLQPSFSSAYTATVYTLYRPPNCTSSFLAPRG